MNCKEWQVRFENFMRRTAAQSTVRRYSAALTEFFKRFPDKRHIEQFYRTDIEDYKILRVDEGMSPRTINFEIAVVRSFWNWMIEMTEEPLFNPAGKVKKLREPQPKKRALPVDLVKRLFECCDDEMDEFIVLFGLTTGARGNEMAQLTWPDVDFEEGVLHIPAEITKSKKEREVPLRADLLKMLVARRKADGLIFNLKTATIRFRFRQICNRAGLTERVGLHALRHTYGTRLARSGMDIGTVQALLGHASLNTTAVYLSPATSAEARQHLDSLPQRTQQPEGTDLVEQR